MTPEMAQMLVDDEQLALSILAKGPKSGPRLREMMRWKKSHASFQGLIQRLLKQRKIHARPEQRYVEGRLRNMNIYTRVQ